MRRRTPAPLPDLAALEAEVARTGEVMLAAWDAHQAAAKARDEARRAILDAARKHSQALRLR